MEKMPIVKKERELASGDGDDANGGGACVGEDAGAFVDGGARGEDVVD